MGERLGERTRPLDKAVDGLRLLFRKAVGAHPQEAVRELIEDTIHFARPSSLPNNTLHNNQLVIPALADTRSANETVWH